MRSRCGRRLEGSLCTLPCRSHVLCLAVQLGMVTYLVWAGSDTFSSHLAEASNSKVISWRHAHHILDGSFSMYANISIFNAPTCCGCHLRMITYPCYYSICPTLILPHPALNFVDKLPGICLINDAQEADASHDSLITLVK